MFGGTRGYLRSSGHWEPWVEGGSGKGDGRFTSPEACLYALHGYTKQECLQRKLLGE